MTGWGLQITEANHADNAFWTLGGIIVDTKRERDAEFVRIPAFEHDCDNDDRCYILDVLDNDGSIVSDKEISADTARTLLGVDDLGPLREQDKAIVNALLATVGLGHSSPDSETGEQ